MSSPELEHQIKTAVAAIDRAMEAIARAQRAEPGGLILGGLDAAELDVRAAQRRLANLQKWLST